MLTIQHLNATAAPLLHQQPGHPNSSPVKQSWPMFDPFTQDVHQRQPRAVLHMQNSSMAVGCLQGCGQAIAIAVEGHSQCLQPFDRLWSFLHEKRNSILIAQSVASPPCVVGMAGDAVVQSLR